MSSVRGITITLTDIELEELDNQRGDMNRSRWIAERIAKSAPRERRAALRSSRKPHGRPRKESDT